MLPSVSEEKKKQTLPPAGSERNYSSTLLANRFLFVVKVTEHQMFDLPETSSSEVEVHNKHVRWMFVQ